MEFYTSCDNITASTFFKIIETDDLRYMVKGFNIHNKAKFKDKDLLKAKDFFDEIMIEYSDLSNNKKLIANYKAQIRIAYLQFKYDTATSIIELYNEFGDLSTIDILNDLDYKIDLEKNIDKQVSIILKKLTGLKNSIKIEQIKFSKKFNDNDNSKDRKLEFRLHEDALSIERVLDLKYSLNPDETVLSKWIALVNMYKNILRKRNNGKN